MLKFSSFSAVFPPQSQATIFLFRDFSLGSDGDEFVSGRDRFVPCSMNRRVASFIFHSPHGLGLAEDFSNI
jgi:hypothetical protein